MFFITLAELGIAALQDDHFILGYATAILELQFKLQVGLTN
jgi:hypothetical protein